MHEVQFLAVRGGYGNQLTPVKLKNARLVGPIEDMRDVYRQTRILLMPSEAETWGRVGLEAMASGIPVIAHPTPGLRESLGDAATFIDRDDDEAWVTEIRRLMRPLPWSEASGKAKAHADRFDPLAELERFRKAVLKVAA
jgi:glycosyltransferase involved in cell wall biosynthesis